MRKPVYTNGSNTGVQAILRHRSTRYTLSWILIFLVGGTLWYYMSLPTVPRRPPQSSVYVHKAEGEIDVLAWPEERWYEAPRNGTQLEKAALIMLVR